MVKKLKENYVRWIVERPAVFRCDASFDLTARQCANVRYFFWKKIEVGMYLYIQIVNNYLIDCHQIFDHNK